MGSAYERQFHIFKTMDNNWENPGGFIKVEINVDNTRFQLSLNNLSDKKDSAYNLYGIHKDGDVLTYTDICRIQPINGRIDLKTNFPIEAIGSNKLNVHDINIYAVICLSTDNKASETIKCPLVAYTKGEQLWKEQFERLLEQPPVIKHDKTPELEAEDKTNYQEISEEAEPEINLTQQDEVIDETEVINIQPWTVLEEAEKEDKEYPVEMPDTENTEQEREDFESAKDAPISELSSKFQGGLSSVYQNPYEEEVREIDESVEQEMEESEETEEFGEAQNVWKMIQDDFNDISSIKIDESKEGKQSGEDRERSFNIQLLRQELDNSFEEYNPFRTRNRSFTWWKINSPGFLNNILFRNNIKTYLLFNPKVMLAHYKYRYIILGIKNNKQLGREKLICGIPGVYNIDDNPFNSVGSWVQMEGFRPKYGAFGYWIVMLDPRTGKLSKMK